MGFIESTVQKNYWKVSNGHIVQKCEEGTPGAVAYKPEMGPNVGKTMYRIVRNGYSGRITKVGFRESSNPIYGTEIEITMRGEGEEIVLCCRAAGRTWQGSPGSVIRSILTM